MRKEQYGKNQALLTMKSVYDVRRLTDWILWDARLLEDNQIVFTYEIENHLPDVVARKMSFCCLLSFGLYGNCAGQSTLSADTHNISMPNDERLCHKGWKANSSQQHGVRASAAIAVD